MGGVLFCPQCISCPYTPLQRMCSCMPDMVTESFPQLPRRSSVYMPSCKGFLQNCCTNISALPCLGPSVRPSMKMNGGNWWWLALPDPDEGHKPKCVSQSIKLFFFHLSVAEVPALRKKTSHYGPALTIGGSIRLLLRTNTCCYCCHLSLSYCREPPSSKN